MKWLAITQIVVAVLLMIAILLQQKGTGLGSTFGGNDTVFLTKRGLEKKLFILTIVLAVLFFGISLARTFF
jgi:preprotein translocase subunit SecG